MTLNLVSLVTRTLCLLTLLVAATVTSAADETPIFTTTYKGEISGWDVEMNRTLVQLGPNQYEFASEAKNLFASIRESSRFQVDDKNIQPLAYVYQRKVFGRKVRETLDFDWNKMLAEYRRSDRSQNNKQHQLQPGLLDPALYQLLLQRDAYRGTNDLNFDFVKRSAIRKYNFSRVGSDTYHFNGKKMSALVLEKQDKDESATTVWLIPELDYQIGKLTHVDDDGSIYQVHLTAYERNPKALKNFYENTP